MDTSVYLHTSIFYPADDWSNLISKGIKPFLNEFNKEVPYLIMLNKERGDNVRFVMQTDTDSFNALANFQNQNLTQFIKTQTFKAVEANIPPSSFFMDFPQGTIHYNLFQYKPVEHVNTDVAIAMETYFYRFSRLLVNMEAQSLAQGLDNLFLFSFQLHWYWGQCYSSSPIVRNALFDNLFERTFSECPGDPEDVSLTLEESFVEHEVSLKEYISDFSGMSSDTSGWISEFIGMSEDLLGTVKRALKEDSEIQSVVSDVLKNINYHVGVENELTMRYFLKRVIANTLLEV